MKLTIEQTFIPKEVKKMELEKIIDVCFFVGIVCGIIGFSIAKLYYMAALVLFIAVETIYSVSSNVYYTKR